MTTMSATTASIPSPTKVLKYIEGPPLEGKPKTGWERFISFVETQPDELAIISTQQSSTLYPNIAQAAHGDAASSCLRWTYRDLKEAVDRFGIKLRSRGVRPGMIIVTFLSNGVESVIARLAASVLGCVLAPLNPKHLVNKDEVTHLLGLFLRRPDSGRRDSVNVVITDEHVAACLEEEHQELVGMCWVKILCTQQKHVQEHIDIDESLAATGWINLQDLLQDELDAPLCPDVSTLHDDTSSTDELIFCTSGTTSLPKACVWTTSQVAYHYHVLEQSGLHELSPEDNVLVCLSNNHIAGYDALSSALFFGGTAVIAGPAFDADEVFKAMVQERVTYTILVPTMVASIARSLPSTLPNRLRINLGGDIATPGIVEQCYHQIGATVVYNTFGNTEGAFLKSGPLDIEQVQISGRAPVGRPSPGQAVKLCSIDTENQNENHIANLCEGSEAVGELHISSPGACSGYLHMTQNPAFYNDEQGRQWYATGDRGHIDSGGKISVIGRYKDMIIRGGENISPAAVETLLSRSFPSIDIQIVGVPDTDGLAGQVPVAVTKTTADAETIMAIRETVRNGMGPASCPEEVVALAQLGLIDYPRTISRKVKKGELVEAVRQYRARQIDDMKTNVQTAPVSVATLNKLRAIWARVLGISESSLSPESHMAELTDSIAATRLLDRVSKAFGKVLTLAELTQADTLQQQADLLDLKASSMGDDPPFSPTSEKPSGPPGIEDMVHLIEKPEQFEATKAKIHQAISCVGLTWDDVREVMPAHDMNRLSVLLGQMNRLNLKSCLVMKDPSISKEQLFDALEAAFATNTQLASFQVLVKDTSSQDQVLHVITSQTRQFLEKRVLSDCGVVDTVEKLGRTASERQFPEHTDATYPGPLIKIDLFSIRETETLALLINANHSILDATSAQLFYEDLDTALTKPTQPLHPGTPYRPWLDSYYALRSSPAAQIAVKYQVECLRDLGQHRHAIWPIHPPAYLPRHIIKKSHTPDGSMLCTFDAPGFTKLRKEHPEIGPHIPLKAAMAMFLMRQTGHTHALYAHTEAERTRWPFWPKSLGERSAADLRGQTLQTVVNITSVTAQETVLSFLKRMQAEQLLQTRHAAAPRLAVMDALGDAGELVPWVANTALFNWSPAKMSASYDAFQVVHLSTNWDVFGFFVMVGMAGDEKLWLHLKGASFGEDDFQLIASELELLTSWLVNPDSWAESASEFRHL